MKQTNGYRRTTMPKKKKKSKKKKSKKIKVKKVKKANQFLLNLKKLIIAKLDMRHQ